MPRVKSLLILRWIEKILIRGLVFFFLFFLPFNSELVVKDSGGMGKEETARQLKAASEGHVESVLLCSSEENSFIDRQLLDSCSRTVFAADPHKY